MYIYITYIYIYITYIYIYILHIYIYIKYTYMNFVCFVYCIIVATRAHDGHTGFTFKQSFPACFT